MNLESAILKFGLQKVLISIFPNLKGIDFNKVGYDKLSCIENSKEFLISKKKQEWFFGSGASPMIFQSFYSGKRDSELESLLIKNKIPIKSKQVPSDQSEDCFWYGNGFKIELLNISKNELILISKENVSASNESLDFETSLAKKTKTPNWIKGFESVYDSNSIKQSNKLLNNFINIPLLFKDKYSEYIIVPVENSKIAEAIIHRIIEDNGGQDSFNKITDIEKLNWIYPFSGHLFSVGYVEKHRTVRINRNNMSKSIIDDNKLESGIHPISDTIQKEIEGFDSLIYNSKEGNVCDGRFFTDTINANDIISFWKEPTNAIKIFKKVVNSYNPEDEFLRMKDTSIVNWMSTYPEEFISFKIPHKCEILLSKGNSIYQINLYPSGGIEGSWENLKKGNYQGDPPEVLFSKNIITKRVLPDLKPPKVSGSTRNTAKNNKLKTNMNKETEEFLGKAIDEDSSSFDNNGKRNNNSLKWILIIIGMILLFLALRTCESGLDKDKTYYYNKGVDYASSGNIEKASENFEKAIEMDGFYVDTYIKRGEMYLENEMYNEAKYDFNQAATYDNSNWRIYYLRGRANMGMGRSKYSRSYKNAVSDFTKSISLNPNSENANSFFYRGVVYKIQESDAACDDFYKACEFNIKEACEIVDNECYPKTGFMPYEKNFGPGVFTGDRRFEINNIEGKTDLVANLISLSTKRKIRSQFVRKGEELIMYNVPNDRYILKIYEGDQWSTKLIMEDNVTKGGFIKNPRFKIIKTVFNFSGFKMRGVEFGVFGDLKSENISENEFFN